MFDPKCIPEVSKGNIRTLPKQSKTLASELFHVSNVNLAPKSKIEVAQIH